MYTDSVTAAETELIGVAAVTTTIDETTTMIGGDEFHSRGTNPPKLSLPVNPLSKASALHQAEAFACVGEPSQGSAS